jgi:hypothetical protein
MSEIDTTEEELFNRGEWVKNQAEDSSTVYDYPTKNNREKGSSRFSYFETNNTHGRHIRNAVNGQYTRHIVGSSDEYLYFSVLIATGESGQTPDCLFYDSPEQYERHMRVVVSDSAKDVWRNRYNSMLKVQQDRLSTRTIEVR